MTKPTLLHVLLVSCAGLLLWATFSACGQVTLLPDQGKNGKFGLRWPGEGKLLVPQEYEDVWGFTEGVCPVKKDGKWGFVDLRGNLVIEPKYEGVWPCSEGLIVVQEGRRWHCITRSGERAFPGDYDGLGSTFSEGLNAVEVGGKWGFLDAQGRIRIQPAYGRMFSFSEGLAAVERDGKWSFIDHAGATILKVEGGRCEGFLNGLALAAAADGKIGFRRAA